METNEIYTYILYGTCIRFLQDRIEGNYINGDGYVLNNIDMFLHSTDKIGLRVTSRAANSLRTFREKLSQFKGKEDGLTSEHAKDLKQIMNDLRQTLDAEAHLFSTYVVTPKIIDVNRLLDDVPSLFRPNIFKSVPVIAQSDFTAAGKCIAYELPTSAAFHILRGTESVLREFYCSFVKRGRLPILLWGPMLQSLKQHWKAKRYIALYSHLDNIRYEERNPTLHPEKNLDIHEAQDLWAICTEVINRMVRILANGSNLAK